MGSSAPADSVCLFAKPLLLQILLWASPGASNRFAMTTASAEVFCPPYHLRGTAAALVVQRQDFGRRERAAVDAQLIDGTIQVMVIIRAEVIEHHSDGVSIACERAHVSG